MNCADAVERLSAALDGELPPARRRRSGAAPRRVRRLRAPPPHAAAGAPALRSTPPLLLDSNGFDTRVLSRVRIGGRPGRPRHHRLVAGDSGCAGARRRLGGAVGAGSDRAANGRRVGDGRPQS